MDLVAPGDLLGWPWSPWMDLLGVQVITGTPWTHPGPRGSPGLAGGRDGPLGGPLGGAGGPGAHLAGPGDIPDGPLGTRPGLLPWGPWGLLGTSWWPRDLGGSLGGDKARLGTGTSRVAPGTPGDSEESWAWGGQGDTPGGPEEPVVARGDIKVSLSLMGGHGDSRGLPQGPWVALRGGGGVPSLPPRGSRCPLPLPPLGTGLSPPPALREAPGGGGAGALLLPGVAPGWGWGVPSPSPFLSCCSPAPAPPLGAGTLRGRGQSRATPPLRWIFQVLIKNFPERSAASEW